MAEATKFENIAVLANGDTITGPGRFYLMLVANGANSELVLTVGSNTVNLVAGTHDTVTTPAPIKIGGSIAATITLTGASAKAYAIYEIG